MNRHEQIEAAARALNEHQDVNHRDFGDGSYDMWEQESDRLAMVLINAAKAQPEDPTPSTERGDVEAMAGSFYEVLSMCRLIYTTDDGGGGLPLVDRLTPAGDGLITRGQEELGDIAMRVAEKARDLIATAERRGAERAARYAWEAGNKTGLIHPVGEEDPAIRENDIRGAVEHATKGGQS